MNILKRLWVFGGAGLLVVAGAAMPAKIVEEVFHDPITYEKPVAEVYEEAKADDEGGGAVGDVKKVIIHYYNTDKKNATREIYTWTTGNDNKYNPMVQDEAGDDYYYHIELDYTGADAAYAGKSFLSFIVKYTGTWSGQSLDTKLEFEEFAPNSEGVVEVWTCPGKAGAVEIYATKKETQMARVSDAYFKDWKTIVCKADEKPKLYRLYAFDKAYLVSTDAVQQRTQHLRLIKEGVPASKNFEIKFNHLAHINVQYVVETEYESHAKVQSIIVTTFELYDNANFKKYYTYTGDDLGCTYSADQTTFKVWAPTAGAVLLNVYNNGTPKSTGYSGASDIKKTYAMTMEKGGVWTKTLLTPAGGDSIEGKYYTYTVYNSEGISEVCDPYAKACGVNGARGMILDFSKTNPENWDKLPLKWDGTERDITTPQQLSIYEVHIRDLTEDMTWTGKARHGSYQAFYEKGTTFKKDGVTVKTGFDHIEEMNVNTVQIMPMFDHDNAELYYYTKDTGEQVYVPSDYSGEYKDKLQLDFNWGYNPLNYNCIEGSYSSNPQDGAARVKEFKELVYAYANNKNKTRITMDVVYNHVSSVSNSNFTKLMPRYYFRFNKAADEYWDGSGCSNEVKSEAPMMSKFIVDSLCWWAKEYKVKGFRFDLMELIDTDTLNDARKALYKIDPDIYLYGEGWKAADSGISSGKKGASTWNTYAYCKPAANSCILGCFNDGGRDAIKGGNDGGNVGHANFEWKGTDTPTTSGGYKYYPLNVGGWSAAGAEVWIHAWKSESDNYDEKLTDTSKLKIKTGYNNFLLVRAKPGTRNIPWDGENFWGKSADMNVPASGSLAFVDWGSVRTPGCWSMMSSGGEGSKVCSMMNGFNGNHSVAQDARQSVNYASCHDNFTLYDQFSWNLGSNPNVAIDGGAANTAPATASIACAVASTEIAIAMSNGVAFMLGGDELLRTKVEDQPAKSRLNEDYVKIYGKCISHNSYKSSVQTNSFKWDRKISVTGYSGKVNDMSEYWKPIAKAFELRNTIKSFAGANVFYGGGEGQTGVGFYGGGYITLVSGKGNNSNMHGTVSGTPLAKVGTVNGGSLGYWSAAIYRA